MLINGTSAARRPKVGGGAPTKSRRRRKQIIGGGGVARSAQGSMLNRQSRPARLLDYSSYKYQLYISHIYSHYTI